MGLLSIDNFQKLSFEKGTRFMGYDVGEKTIGLALSDTQKMIASPLKVIHRTQWKKDSHVLLKEIIDHNVAALIIGWPLNMNGTQGPRCQATQQFANNLLKLKDLPICLWDERLSTAAVTRTLLEADISRAKRKPVVDQLAASYILQGFLDGFNKVK